MIGSLGSMIAQYYSRLHMNMNIDYFGIDDHYTPQGKIEELLELEKISVNDLIIFTKEKLNEKSKYGRKKRCLSASMSYM